MEAAATGRLNYFWLTLGSAGRPSLVTRRDVLLAAAALGGVGLLPSAGQGQTISPKTIDPDFVRMWDGVQVDRPGSIGNRASLVGVGEPGTPLVHPGPYPGRSVASHIHLGLDGPVGQRQTLEDVRFEGDPLLSDEQKQRAKAAGRFGNIVRVTTHQGREECEIMLRLTGEYVF